MLFKELKKSILKNSMKINRGISTYVGKSIIENKEKYRIPYGSPASPPEEDFDISDMVWEEKGERRKIKIKGNLRILVIWQIVLINYDLI